MLRRTHGRLWMLAALPVWIGPPAGSADRGEVTFTGVLDLARQPDRALARVSAQQRFTLSVDGKAAALGDAATPWVFDLGRSLRRGKHRVDVTVQADPVPAPDNAWVVLHRDLGAPRSADRLVIETEGARQDEWLYIEVIDAKGDTSGYFCPERGHPALRLGSSGERRRHVIDLRRDDRLGYRGSGPCDTTRLRALNIRVDQKTTSTRPRGGLTFRTVRLEGAANADLGDAAGWQVAPGAGDHRRARLSAAGEGFALALDFGPAADVRLALDLRAFAGSREVGRLVSGPDWTSDAGGVAVTPRGRGPGGLHSEYWPADIRDILEVGAPPIAALAELSVNGGVDRVRAGEPLQVAVRLRALEPGAYPDVLVRAADSSNAVAQEVRAPVAWQGREGTATLALAGLPRGLYTVEAVLGPAARSHRRGVALAALGPGEKRVSAVFDTLRPSSFPPRGLQGIDLSYRDSPAMLMGVRMLGVNFLQFHLEPGQIDNGELDELIAFCKATAMRFALNNETSNWAASARRPDGTERFDAPGGCHRWDIEAEALARASASGRFEGVVYDEGEHMQLCRNYYSGLPDRVRRKPYLVETTGLDLQAAHEALVGAAAGVAAYNASPHGGRMLVESVFPVLWHPLARAGVTLAPKLLKEDVHPVVLAHALGAARQHGADLWFSPDLWHMDQLPGHSVREYRAALRLAHAAGVDNVYTEFATVLALDHGAAYEITPYGEELTAHLFGYVPAHPRTYTYRDYRPETAIVRFPDSDWGQASCTYWNTLYGAENLQSTPETREWLVVWSLITGGGTHPAAVNANSGVYDRYQWRFGMPSPAVAVFDHLVTGACLEGVKRIWLCGTRVSPQGLQAVRDAVRAGATCVAAQRLCPPDVVLGAAAAGRCRDGRGEWVVVPGFTPDMMAPLAPEPLPDGMRLRFGRRTVTITDP